MRRESILITPSQLRAFKREEGNRMPNDAREVKRAWWPGDFASSTSGSSAPAADDRLHSRASTPPKAGTKLEALRELALAKSPGRAKLSARVSPPRWGGRTIGRDTDSFFSKPTTAEERSADRAKQKWKRVYALTLLILVAVTASCFAANTAEKADDIRVKAEVDKAFLTIGDPVTYTVTVEHAPDIQILSTFPSPASDILEIKKVEDIHKKLKKKVITGRKFTLTTFKLGEFVLDPITIQYRKEGQAPKSIQTNKLYLTVKSVAAGDLGEDIRDVKSVVPFKMRLGKFFWIVITLAIIASGYLLFRALRKKKLLAAPAPPPLTAEEEALLHLGELFESDLLKRGLIKFYYLRLSEILRIYFERRYKVLAVESTTLEILRALRPLHLEPTLYQKIQYVLEASDLAKFAKWIPSAPETFQLNKKTEEIIKESVPVLERALAEAPRGV